MQLNILYSDGYCEPIPFTHVTHTRLTLSDYLISFFDTDKLVFSITAESKEELNNFLDNIAEHGIIDVYAEEEDYYYGDSGF